MEIVLKIKALLRVLLTSLLLISLTGISVAQETIKVGIHHYPPFVIKKSNGQVRGLCIDLWEQLAQDLALDFEYVEYYDKTSLIRALDYDEIDISINPLTVSSTRLQLFEVSQPFLISSVGVAATTGSQSRFQVFLSNFFSADFIRVVLLLLLIIFFFGTILWLVERRFNKFQFRPGPIGLLDGLWWSAVTMTTVGYGDKAPKTTAGKVIAIVWMFTAVIIISSFTATIASTLTVSSLEARLQSMEELRQISPIGTVRASGGDDFLQASQISVHQYFSQASQGLSALARKDIKVLVYQKSVMRYLIGELELEDQVQLLPVKFNQEYRSFLFPKNSPLFERVNPRLVEFIGYPSWREMLKGYGLQMEE